MKVKRLDLVQNINQMDYSEYFCITPIKNKHWQKLLDILQAALTSTLIGNFNQPKKKKRKYIQ